MNNFDKYKKAFKETFMVEDSDLKDLKYQGVATWDSVGHMALMAELEESFEIELDIEYRSENALAQ